MFDYAISKRLGSSFVLNVIYDDLTARIFAWLDFICPKLRPCRSR